MISLPVAFTNYMSTAIASVGKTGSNTVVLSQSSSSLSELNVLVYNGAGSQTTVSDLVVNWLVIGY
jgi:hypothetical protein